MGSARVSGRWEGGEWTSPPPASCTGGAPGPRHAKDQLHASGACQSRARVSALTEPRHSRPSPAGSGRTDRQSRHKEETAQGPGRGREKGRERGDTLPKSEAPPSTHSPRGSRGRGCGGAWCPERGGERKRRREGSREIRRQAGGEEGGGGGGKEGAEEEERRQRPGGRAGGGDRFV